MPIHTATLALVQTPALGPLDKSASLVSLTLGDCSAELVSRRLGCSAELAGLPRDAELDAVQERARLQRIANEARKASEHALDVARKAEAEIAALDAKGEK